MEEYNNENNVKEKEFNDVVIEEDEETSEEEINREFEESYLKEYDGLIGRVSYLYNKIIKSKNNKERVLLIDTLISLCDYLEEVGFCFNEDIAIEMNNVLDVLGTKYEKINNKDEEDIKKIFANKEIINKLNNKLLEFYQENNYCLSKTAKKDKIDLNYGFYVLECFFKNLGDDVYNLYCNMAENKHITIVNPIYESTAYTLQSNYQDNSYIISPIYPNCFYQLICICHEMGHAYQDNLLRNQSQTTGYHLYTEFFSQLFENLFLSYLRKNNLFEEERSNRRLERYKILYDQSCICKIILFLMNNGLVNEKKLKDEDYLSDKFDEVENEEELSDVIDIIDYDYKFSWTHLVYVIDNCLGEYFARRMEINYQKGFKEAKEFILSAYYYPLEEIIDKYLTDLTPTYDDIKETIQSVRVKNYIKK